MAYKAGDILSFDYTGAAQSVELPAGRYLLEVWGAQGGSYSTYYGGRGGYSKGVLSLPKVSKDATTKLFICVGQQPASVTGSRETAPGGFNGGGNGQTRYYSGTYTYGQGGGGGTDIRIGTDSLYARVIVAGGGGGSASVDAATTKYGGGASGGSPKSGYGASQTAPGTNGSFGQGGDATTSGTNYKYGSGGGGGGWYGGGACSSYSDSTNYRGYNGGGSGFVWTGANATSGYLLGEDYYLADAQTIAGNQSFTGPNGTAETGHAGNGFAKITVLEIYAFAPPAPGNFRQTSQDYFEIGLAWDASEGATGYNLYKDGALIYTGTDLSYLDTQGYPSTSYIYQVTAFSAEGEGDPATLEASTKAGWAVIEPVFLAASISPNPVGINQSILISVQLTDAVRILEAETFYSGELYAGEV